MFSVSLTFYRPQTSWISTKPLYGDSLAFAVPATFGAEPAETKFAQMKRLGEVPLALPTHVHGLRQTIEQEAAAARLSLDVQFEFASIHLLREAVGHGLAASVLPMSLLAAFVPSKRLNVSRLVSPAFARTLYVTSSLRRPLSPALSEAKLLLEETALAAIARAPVAAFYRKA